MVELLDLFLRVALAWPTFVLVLTCCNPTLITASFIYSLELSAIAKYLLKVPLVLQIHAGKELFAGSHDEASNV